VDEDWSQVLGMDCGVGACAGGVVVCLFDGLGTACSSDGEASDEICNGMDDDCDGEYDEGNPGGGSACSTGQLGQCDAGTTSCDSGQLWCIQDLQPSIEVCDGEDNDCDGAEDEGNPGGGGACATGLAGVCAAGTTNCTDGLLLCDQNVQASAEICDGEDNDCDGSEDEGNPGGGGACATGLMGVCAAGTINCTGGALMCDQNVQAAAEICDGLDNDCDGGTDEGNPGGGFACSTGQLGVCAAGTTNCSGGTLSCNRNVEPSEEICDDLDNDCDGEVDEELMCPSCIDGVHNGEETDVDCGGPTCSPCALDNACIVNSDCTSNSCVDNICVP
jgi:hypothetical protein